jgi:hypothetical protein
VVEAAGAPTHDWRIMKLDRFTFLLGGYDGESLFDPAATSQTLVGRCDPRPKPRRSASIGVAGARCSVTSALRTDTWIYTASLPYQTLRRVIGAQFPGTSGQIGV